MPWVIFQRVLRPGFYFCVGKQSKKHKLQRGWVLTPVHTLTARLNRQQWCDSNEPELNHQQKLLKAKPDAVETANEIINYAGPSGLISKWALPDVLSAVMRLLLDQKTCREGMDVQTLFLPTRYWEFATEKPTNYIFWIASRDFQICKRNLYFLIFRSGLL